MTVSAMFSLVDSHCHFDDEQFVEDRPSVYQRARHVGVETIIVPGVCARWWPRLKTVVASYPGLYAAYGLHPLYVDEHYPQHLDQLMAWCQQEKPVAVGECGLDFFIPQLPIDRQRYYFEAQLEIAQAQRLPVIVHARRAVEAVLDQARCYPGLRGVIHSFSGSEQQARRLLDLGWLLSFGGPVTYPRAKRLRQLVQVLPLDGFMLETDAPDQPGSLHRGERNEPAFLMEVLMEVAQLRGQDPAEIAATHERNASDLFGIPRCSPSSTAPKS